MARVRIPALSRHVAVAGAVVAHRSATREVQVVLSFAGAHPLEMARAHTLDDPELRVVAAKLFGYFDDARAPVPVGLRA